MDETGPRPRTGVNGDTAITRTHDTLLPEAPMHVVIAWWDERRTTQARDPRPHPSGKSELHPRADEFPGLCTSR